MRLHPLLALLLFVPWQSALVTEVFAADQPAETLFKQHCAACHPDGGNIMKKEKTLHKKELQANKLLTAKDLVRYMRNPGPGMPGFDSKSLPDKDAARLAEYILKSFK